MGEIWHLYHSEVHVTPKPRTIIFNVIIIIRVLSCDCRIPYTCTCCCFFLLLTRQGSSTQKYIGKYVSKFFWRTTMLHVQFVILVLLCNSYIFISRQCVQRSLVLLFNSYHCFLSLIPWGLFDKIGQWMHLRTYTIGYDDSKVSSMIFLLYNMLLYCHLLEYMRIFGSLRIFKKSFIDGYKKSCSGDQCGQVASY